MEHRGYVSCKFSYLGVTSFDTSSLACFNNFSINYIKYQHDVDIHHPDSIMGQKFT